MRATRVAAAVLLATATSSLPARAGAPPAAGAAELLDAQATSLMQEHRYAEACPKLAESDRIKPGTGVLLRLALCYEMSGRTASAWSAFREAAGRARRAGDASAAELATKRAEGLEARVPKLVVRLPPELDAEHVDVQLDAAPLAPSTLGVEVPIDPGPHTLQASAPGRRSSASRFVVADRGATTAIALDLAPDTRGRAQRTAALVAGGVGVASVVAGTILGIAAMTTWNHARSECKSGATGCSSDALGLQGTVNTEAAGSTIAFSVGVVGIAGGAILWWTAPRAARTAYVVAPAFDGRSGGFTLSGSF